MASSLDTPLKRLSAAMTEAQGRRDVRARQERERQRLAKTAFFPSLLGGRGAISPLGGVAKPAEQPKTKARGGR